MPDLLREQGHSRSQCCLQQVPKHDTAQAASHRSEDFWNEDGLIRAGSRQNMRKGQIYRASPPANLQEALDRQRRLLHGQDLRNYWNVPKVTVAAVWP